MRSPRRALFCTTSPGAPYLTAASSSGDVRLSSSPPATPNIRKCSRNTDTLASKDAGGSWLRLDRSVIPHPPFSGRPDSCSDTATTRSHSRVATKKSGIPSQEHRAGCGARATGVIHAHTSSYVRLHLLFRWELLEHLVNRLIKLFGILLRVIGELIISQAAPKQSLRRSAVDIDHQCSYRDAIYGGG